MPLNEKGFYRPAATPADNLPFSARSAGYSKVQPPYFTGRERIISFVQLFWCVRGSGIIEFSDKPCVLKQNQIALYYPNMRACWHTDRQDWEFYWMTIDGPFAASLTSALGLEAGIYNAGPAPVALFKTLQRLVVAQTSRQAELRACAIAFTILTRAAGSHADQTDALMDKAVQYMNRQYFSPTLNIKTLAAGLGIGRAAFFTRFRIAMGMTPGAYLERLRLQNALSMLKQKHLTIAEVAARCGYPDANYFSRVIRRTTGRSPLQFRKYWLKASSQERT